MAKIIYNAIVFFDPEKKIRPRKYRNISNVYGFANFCCASGAKYINFYFAKDKQFSHRVYLDFQYL